MNLINRICSPGSIILDRIETYPNEIMMIVESNYEILNNYIKKEEIIDKKAITNVILRIRRTFNEFSIEWNDILNSIKDILINKKFIGFHCTRLINYEINYIIENGLMPLDPNFTKQRLDYLVKNKLISINNYKHLLTNNASNLTYRKGRIFFFHCISTFRDMNGLYRLFRSWGGEAIYFNNENDINIFNEIKLIGKPYIIIAELDYNDLINYHDLSEKLIIKIINNRKRKRSSIDFDSSICHNVSIYKYISIDNPDFDKLTKYKNWRYQID
ncbi:MAG: hypothetical protein HW421_2016 [Ignavibacteria bacterium]|nr:hypothetical protein [Ignavibacteria bacterium]